MILTLFQTLRGQKKRFYRMKIRDVQYAIWDMEFKINKSRQVREGIRMDRDRQVESIRMIEARLAGELSKEDREKFEADKKAIEANIERFERQMQMVDNEINGVPPSEDHGGQQGLLEYLAGYVELKAMLTEEYKKL